MYDKKKTTSHQSSFTITAATAVRGIRRLLGYRYCRIVDILGTVTTAIVATSTPPKINIGDGTTAAKFAAQTVAIDAAAVGAAYGCRDADGRVAAYATTGAAQIDWNSAGDGGAALTKLVITPVAGTGGSVAGVVEWNIVLEWWN